MSVILLLTGCSEYDPNGNVTVGWENGEILYDGKPTGLTEYYGNTARVEGGQGGLTYEFSLDTDTVTVENISCNTQGILETDMTKYKGKWYYSEYLGSKMTMASEVAESTFMVCQVYVGQQSSDLVATYASNYLDAFRLTNGYVFVDFGPLVFGSGYDIVKVTNQGASISGVAKVTYESKGCDTPYTLQVDDKTSVNLMMKETEKYVYYEYEGYCIQLSKGLDLNTYVKFK